MRLGNLLTRTLAPAALCALVIAACGSQHRRSTGRTSSSVTAPIATSATTTTATSTGPSASTTTASPSQNVQTVAIYSSLPRGGPERVDSMQIERGIGLALGRISLRGVPRELRSSAGIVFRLRYTALNDSRTKRVRHHRAAATPSTRDRTGSELTTVTFGNTGHWNAAATVRNAQTAIGNPETIAYIGDLDSGATELSLPILNQAGIMQITPGSGYPGLTDSYHGVTAGGEPDRYYPQTQSEPQQPRTLLRMIPSDIVQASAALHVLRSAGCQHVAAWDFGSTPESLALLNAVRLTASTYGMKYSIPPALPSPGHKKTVTSAGYYYGYVHALAPEDLRCAVMVGHVTTAATALTTELRLQTGVPGIPIVGTSGFCDPSWVRSIPKLVPKSQARSVIAGLFCTQPALPIWHYTGTRGPQGFIAIFRRRYRQQPTAYAYYGYQAAEMVIRALRDMPRHQDYRSELVSDLVNGFPDNVTNPFSFDEKGNLMSYGTGLTAGYGVYLFDNGVPSFHQVVAPSFANLLSSDG